MTQCSVVPIKLPLRIFSLPQFGSSTRSTYSPFDWLVAYICCRHLQIAWFAAICLLLLAALDTQNCWHASATTFALMWANQQNCWSLNPNIWCHLLSWLFLWDSGKSKFINSFDWNHGGGLVDVGQDSNHLARSNFSLIGIGWCLTFQWLMDARHLFASPTHAPGFLVLSTTIAPLVKYM